MATERLGTFLERSVDPRLSSPGRHHARRGRPLDRDEALAVRCVCGEKIYDVCQGCGTLRYEAITSAKVLSKWLMIGVWRGYS